MHPLTCLLQNDFSRNSAHSTAMCPLDSTFWLCCDSAASVHTAESFFHGVCCSKMVDATSYYELEVGLSCMVQKSGVTLLHPTAAPPNKPRYESTIHDKREIAGTWCPAATCQMHQLRVLRSCRWCCTLGLCVRVSSVQAEEYARKGVTLTPELWLVKVSRMLDTRQLNDVCTGSGNVRLPPTAPWAVPE